MEASGSQSWFLSKHIDGSVFGPLTFEQMRQWAESAQIAPHDKISHDHVSWLKAPMYPELGMDWLVEVTSERYYGPTTLGAVREFIRLGEISEETFIINSCDGSRRPIGKFPKPTQETDHAIHTSSDAPSASPMAINPRDRISDLEQILIEERRALEECEARYRELEAQYRELRQNQGVAS